MCRSCLLEVRPDRARFVAESGAFTLNYAGCHGCNGVKQPIACTKRVVEENSATEVEDGEYEEVITYERQTPGESDNTCSVCAHVIAEHYYSFRVVKTAIESEEPSSVAEPAAADAVPPAMRITHDYYMECVLCGKGVDEQVHSDHAADSASASATSAAAAASAPLPTISLSSIAVHSAAAAPTVVDQKEEEEWA